MNGDWSYVWQGDREDLFEKYGRTKMTMLVVMKQRFPNEDDFDHVEGAYFTHVTDIKDAIEASKIADIIV